MFESASASLSPPSAVVAGGFRTPFSAFEPHEPADRFADLCALTTEVDHSNPLSEGIVGERVGFTAFEKTVAVIPDLIHA
jgi:hypothetical protein